MRGKMKWHGPKKFEIFKVRNAQIKVALSMLKIVMLLWKCRIKRQHAKKGNIQRFIT